MKTLHDKDAVRPVFNTRKVKTFALAIPLLLALIAIPVKKDKMDRYNPFNYQTSATAPINLKEAPRNIMDQSEAITSEKTKASDEITLKSIDKKEPVPSVDPSIEVKPIKKEVSESPIATPVHEKYHIIGGCFKMKENAEKQMTHLKSAGFKSTVGQVPNGNYVVTVQSYADKNEAVTALTNLRNQEPEAGYWMSVK
jgi:cell division protein FtsN